MRICIFARSMRAHKANYPTPFGFLLPTLTDLGCEITVLTTAHPDSVTLRHQESGADVHYLAGTTPRTINDNYWTESARAFDELSDKCGRFDLVMGRGDTAWGFLEHSVHATSVPLITHEGTYPQEIAALENHATLNQPWLRRPVTYFARRRRPEQVKTHMRAARVVANSPKLGEALRELYRGKPVRTSVITYGFSSEPYEQSYIAYGADAPKRIVTVARLTEKKGVFAMADVLASMRNKDVIFEAIGPIDNRLKEKVTTYAAKRGVLDRYRIPGPVKNEELPERLAGASAFALLTTHPEGVPKSLLEAMAAGLPSVVYRFGGCETLIEHGTTGYIVGRKDIAGAAASLDDLIDQPVNASQMGQSARKHLRDNFSPIAIREKWRALLSEVVDP
ncbi:MAG: glycosyltransferase family 4 protein [Pseudomonadota bacterium]